MIIKFYLEADIDAEDLLKVSNRLTHKVLNRPEEGLIAILKIQTEEDLEESEIEEISRKLSTLDIFVDHTEV
jgi:microcompartment protein CcmL/EutN